jgi:hypothetical protein
MKSGVFDDLARGPLFRFADWPTLNVPDAPGVYTNWDDEQFLYCGIATAMRGRLATHASGRQGSDFCRYRFHRLILANLTRDQLERIAAGRPFPDVLTKTLVRGRLSFRFVIIDDDAITRAVERSMIRDGLPGQQLEADLRLVMPSLTTTAYDDDGEPARAAAQPNTAPVRGRKLKKRSGFDEQRSRSAHSEQRAHARDRRPRDRHPHPRSPPPTRPRDPQMSLRRLASPSARDLGWSTSCRRFGPVSGAR